MMQFAPVIGPALGPIGASSPFHCLFSIIDANLVPVGGYISQYATWRWAFWTVVIFNVAVHAVAFFLLKETYAPRLLVLKARKLRKESCNPEFKTAWEREQRTLTKILRVSLSRPWVMLATQPIIQSLAILQAFNFGLLYLVISGFPTLWEEHYGMSKGRASLNYISIAVGSLIGVLICAPTMDAVYRRLKTKSGIGMEEQGSPEYRIPLMIPSSVITPAGMLLFAWSAQNRMHFLIPNVSLFRVRNSLRGQHPDSGPIDWHCDNDGKHHDIVPMHLGLRSRLLSAVHRFCFGCMLFHAVHVRFRVSAVCSSALRKTGIWTWRKSVGWYRGRHWDPGTDLTLGIWRKATGYESVQHTGIKRKKNWNDKGGLSSTFRFVIQGEKFPTHRGVRAYAVKLGLHMRLYLVL